MGQGTKIAGLDAPEHAALIDDIKEQLLIAFLRRLVDKGGELRVPIAEIDAIGGWNLALRVDFEKRDFVFSLQQKQ